MESLFAFDQDMDAQKNLYNDNRLIFVPHNFRYLQNFLRLHNVMQVDGVLADLGVSSHQFDVGRKRFFYKV
jgi:16S rRNA (cytosine1402-N4)-methyltransferase